MSTQKQKSCGSGTRNLLHSIELESDPDNWEGELGVLPRRSGMKMFACVNVFNGAGLSTIGWSLPVIYDAEVSTTYCLLLTTHYILLTTYYSLLTTHDLLLTTYYSLLTTHYLLLTTYYSLLTTNY